MGWAVTALQQAAHNFSLLRLFNYTWECGNGEAGDAAVGMGLVQKSILVAITFLVFNVHLTSVERDKILNNLN